MSTTATNGHGSRATATTTAERPTPEVPFDHILEATRQARQYSIEEVRYMADATAKSGMFNLTAPQAFVLMQLCEAEGLHPIQAVRRYDIIDGKPAMKAAAIQAEFQRHGGRIVWLERTSERFSAEFTHPSFQPDPLTITITLDELKKSGVAVGRDGGLKANYRRHPRSMLHARCISEGVRAIDPGIVVGLYTPEELSDSEETTRPSPATRKQDDLPQLDVTVEKSEPYPHPVTREPRSIPITPLRAFVEECLTTANDAARNIWLIENKAADYRDIPPQQIANHLAKWLQLPDEAIEDERGKRSNAKIAEVLADAWAKDEAPMRAEIQRYIHQEHRKAATEAGIELADDDDDVDYPDDGVAMADGD